MEPRTAQPTSSNLQDKTLDDIDTEGDGFISIAETNPDDSHFELGARRG